MPTPLKAIVSRTRDTILAPLTQTGAIGPDLFWSDTELLNHTIAGCRDLWRAVVDLHHDHFFKVDVTNVSYVSGASTLTGVPSDTLRVLLIGPRDTTSSSTTRYVKFTPAKYNSVEFRRGLSQDPLDPGTTCETFYVIANAGSPVMSPDIYIAPTLSATVPLRFVYVPTLPNLTADSMNPIPGESDHALMAWTAAYALGKQNPDGTLTPDATWLAVYSTEKEAIKIVSEPRQEQQPRVVRGVFDDIIGPGLSGDGWSDSWW